MTDLISEAKPKLTVVLGQPDVYSTSFQTRNLAAALSPWFQPQFCSVPSRKTKFWRSFSRMMSNFIRPFFTRPRTEYLLYCNDGVADLKHWSGTRIIYWYDAPEDWSERPPKRSNWVQRLRYENIRRAEHVLAVSATQVRVARALRPGREDSVAYLPVGVDCRIFDPARGDAGRIRARYALPGKPIVGYLGYLGAMHGRFAGEILLDAATEILKRHDAHFLIVGFGPALDAWKERVAQLNLSAHVTFTGYVQDEDVPHCIAAMDVCVDTLEEGFHSEARSETKLKQYMAMGRACVATAIGENCADLDGGKCGVLVKPGAALLAEAISGLLQDEERRNALGRAARERALACYDWPVLAERFVRAIGLKSEPPGE